MPPRQLGRAAVGVAKRTPAGRMLIYGVPAALLLGVIMLIVIIGAVGGNTALQSNCSSSPSGSQPSSQSGSSQFASVGGAGWAQQINHLYPATSDTAPGVKLPPDVLAALAESAGKTLGVNIPGVTMQQVTIGESSSGAPGDVGHDPNGVTVGYGLWQITTGVGNDAMINSLGGPSKMLNPINNALAMAHIYQSGGIGSWYGISGVTQSNAHYTGSLPLVNLNTLLGQSGGASPALLAGSSTSTGGGQSCCPGSGNQAGSTLPVSSSNSSSTSTSGGGSFTFPLPSAVAGAQGTWTKDQGVDITAPGNTPLIAVGSGTIVLRGIQGFGPSAPVLKLDTPVNGVSYVYYGHAGPAGPPVGTHVAAGGVIGEVGAGIVGLSSGPHLEIGSSDASGTPTSGSASVVYSLLASSTKLTAPSSTSATSLPVSGSSAGGTACSAQNVSVSAGGFTNPFPGGWTPYRLDMGYDGTFKGQIVSPVSGKILIASASCANWGGYIAVQADTPTIAGLASNVFYFSEGVAPLVTAGQHVSAGAPIAATAPSPFGDPYATGGLGEIEWGLSNTSQSQAPSSCGTLAESGAVPDPRAMVLQFSQWAQTVLHLPPPTETIKAGVA